MTKQFKYSFHPIRLLPITFILLSLLNSCSNLFVFRDDPKINKGELDLTNFDFTKHKTIHLIGDAEFYWNRLLTPSDFDSNCIKVKSYIPIPGVWNGRTIDGNTLGGSGIATYRIIIEVPKEDIYGLKLNEFDCAYKIWANGMVDSVGHVGKNKVETIPAWNRREIYFNSVNKKAEIVIQIANFSHRKGGPEDVMIFGTAESIIHLKQKQVVGNYSILVILLLTAFTHLLVYFLRKKDKTALVFSLLCFGMALRLASTSEKLILELIPSIPWHIAVRLEYFSYTICMPLMAAFIQLYFPKDFSNKVVKYLFLITLAFVSSYLFLPVKLFSYTPIIFQVIVFFTAIYLFYALIKALIYRRENALLFLLSYSFFFLIILNDILYYNKMINTSFLMPFGLAFMVISQSFALTKSQVQAFTDNEKLSAELDRYNQELENIVHERTKKIQHQNEELEAQADKLKEINEKLIELSQFKDNMTGMVVHDMKNHLNNIILLSENQEGESNELFDINDAMRHSAKQLFTLVMNILDIQRFEDAHMELDLQNISINPIVDNVRKDLDAMSRSKEISIINLTDKNTYVKADPVIVHRIFINLISNAIKFSPTNTSIKICSNNDDGLLKFQVVDNGVGIPDTIKEKIFNKYETFNHQSDNKFQSTGLGLTFCKLAVEAHNGKIGVADAEKQGSIFWFTLPVGIAPNVNHINKDEGETTNEKLILSESDIQNLGEFAVKLSKVKYYEVSRVNLILTDIKVALDENYSEPINNWISSIKKAVIHSSKEVFESKIREVLERYKSN